jgi:hypothetical protein
MAAALRLTVLVVLAPVLAVGLAGAQRAGPAATAVSTQAVPAPPAPAGSGWAARRYSPVAEPVRIRIPAVGVTSSLQRLGRQRDGTIAVPRPAAVAGWYREGPRPGQPGPAVILGHVDSRTGPGVFFALADLSSGAMVHVDRADGSTVAFRVTRVDRVPKARFPTDLVYAPTLQPSLRLVTCGGSYDADRRSYRDNVIVYAIPA